MDTKRCAKKSSVKVEDPASAIWRPFDSSQPHQSAFVTGGGVKSEPATPLSLTFNDPAPTLESSWDLPPPCLPRVLPDREVAGNSSPSDSSAPQISPVVSPIPSYGISAVESSSDARNLSESPVTDRSAKKHKSRKRRTHRASNDQSSRPVRVEQLPDVEKKVGVVQGLPRKYSTNEEKDECGTEVMASANIHNLSDPISSTSNNSSSALNSSASAPSGSQLTACSAVGMEPPRPYSVSHGGYNTAAAAYNMATTSPYMQTPVGMSHMAFGGNNFMVPLSPMFSYNEMDSEVMRSIIPPAHQPHLLTLPYHSTPHYGPSPTSGLGPVPSTSFGLPAAASSPAPLPLKTRCVSRACSPVPALTQETTTVLTESVAVQTDGCTCWRCVAAAGPLGDPGIQLSLGATPFLISPDSTATSTQPSQERGSPADAVAGVTATDALNTLYKVAQTILGEPKRLKAKEGAEEDYADPEECGVEHGNCVGDLDVCYDMARLRELPAPGAVSHFPQLEGIQDWERGTLRQMHAIQSRVRSLKSEIRRHKKRHPSAGSQASSRGASHARHTTSVSASALPPPPLELDRQEAPPQSLSILAACAVDLSATASAADLEDIKEEPPTLTAAVCPGSGLAPCTEQFDSAAPFEAVKRPRDQIMPDLSLSIEAANNPPIPIYMSPPAVARKRGHTHDGVSSSELKKKRPKREKDKEARFCSKEDERTRVRSKETPEKDGEEKKQGEEEEEEETPPPLTRNLAEAGHVIEGVETSKTLYLDMGSAKNDDRVIFLMGKLKTGRLMVPVRGDSYGLVFDCDRGGGPHQILSGAELGNMVIREVRPASDKLAVGTRVCAYWSKYQSHLYPGHIDTPEEDEEEMGGPGFVYINFDDQFCGWIELGHVRLLPADFPVLPCEDEVSLTLPLGRRRARSGEMPILRLPMTTETASEPPEAAETPLESEKPEEKVEEKKEEGKGEEEEKKEEKASQEQQEGKEEESDQRASDEERKKKKKKKKKKKRRVTWRWADAGQRKGGRIFYKAVERSQDGERVKVGDAVLFSSGGDRPYLGQVHAMFENADSPGSPMFVCATWYYQPREMGAAVEPSLKELKSAVFASKHADENDARTILRKIRVLPNYATYKKYRRKSRHDAKAGRPGHSMKDVFFTAGRYDPLASKVLQYDQTLRRLYIDRKSGAQVSTSSSSSTTSSSAEALWAAATETCAFAEKAGEEVVPENNNAPPDAKDEDCFKKPALV